MFVLYIQVKKGGHLQDPTSRMQPRRAAKKVPASNCSALGTDDDDFMTLDDKRPRCDQGEGPNNRAPPQAPAPVVEKVRTFSFIAA